MSCNKCKINFTSLDFITGIDGDAFDICRAVADITSNVSLQIFNFAPGKRKKRHIKNTNISNRTLIIQTKQRSSTSGVYTNPLIIKSNGEETNQIVVRGEGSVMIELYSDFDGTNYRSFGHVIGEF